jgi:hypothetical protein
MTIPSVTPFAGQLPDEGEPATFPARAEALFDWLTINAAPEIDAVADAINLALNDNGTVLDTAGRAIAITRNANTAVPTAGNGNAYTIIPVVGISAYQEGDTFLIRPDRANTGPVSLKVDNLAAVSVRKPSTTGSGFVNLAPGDWQANDVHVVTYRDGQFELLTIPLQSFVRQDTPQNVSALWNFAVSPTFTNPATARANLGLGLVSSQTFGGVASRTFPMTGFRTYELEINDLLQNTGGAAAVNLRFSANGGSTFYATLGQHVFINKKEAIADGTSLTESIYTSAFAGGTSDRIVLVNNLDSGSRVSGKVRIITPGAVAHTTLMWELWGDGGRIVGTGRLEVDAAINALSVYGPTFANGTGVMRGIY